MAAGAAWFLGCRLRRPRQPRAVAGSDVAVADSGAGGRFGLPGGRFGLPGGAFVIRAHPPPGYSLHFLIVQGEGFISRRMGFK